MEWLFEKFVQYSKKNCIIFEGQSFSYGDLMQKISFYENEINGKIASSDIVAIISDYSFNAIALLLALAKNNNIIVPITSNVDAEIDDRIKEAQVDVSIKIEASALNIEKCVSTPEKYALMQQIHALKASGLILFSSGSTGKPKAMIHNLTTFINSFKDRKEKNMNFLVFLMFDHIGGLNTLFNCLSMGMVMTIPSSREADHIFELIDKFKVNVLPVSPTFLNLILMSGAYKKYDVSSLKLISYGTEAMPEAVLLKVKEVFPGVKLAQTFGTSETGIAQITSKSSTSTLIKIDDPNLEYKIIDDELWLKSKTQILGYLNASMERFVDDGWFKTGDLVQVAEDGYLRIVGRNSEVINVGGQKVLPAEVESVLMQIDNIADVSVYAKLNPITGNVVAANVVLEKEEALPLLRRRILLYCKDKLDSYKMPVDIQIKDKLTFSNRFKKVRN